MSKTRLLLGISRRSSRALFIVKLLLTLVIIVSAVTIDSTQKTFTAELGSAANVASNLLMTDRGFSTASSSAVANGNCTNPVIFGPLAGVGNNVITSGHIVYTVRVNSTMGAPAGKKYNVTFTLGSTSYGPVCIQTAAVPLNGQIIDCKFDIAATTLPGSIYTFKVTIQ